MTYRTILAAASGSIVTESVVELACRLAQRFNAHVEGFHVKVDPVEILVAASSGFAMPVYGHWVDQMTGDIARETAKAKAAFETAALRHRLVTTLSPPCDVASAAWQEVTGDAGVLVSRRARLFDLVVLGRSGRVAKLPSSDTIEQTLLGSGRPVLLAPAMAPPSIGHSIALAWNDTPAAVKAMAAALPFLKAARLVTVITVARDTDAIQPVAEYLAWHGIKAETRELHKLAHTGWGAHLLIETHNIGADLLVMGGFGHAPWREEMFGGATQEVIATAMLPVLITH